MHQTREIQNTSSHFMDSLSGILCHFSFKAFKSILKKYLSQLNSFAPSSLLHLHPCTLFMSAMVLNVCWWLCFFAVWCMVVVFHAQFIELAATEENMHYKFYHNHLGNASIKVLGLTLICNRYPYIISWINELPTWLHWKWGASKVFWSQKWAHPYLLFLLHILSHSWLGWHTELQLHMVPA